MSTGLSLAAACSAKRKTCFISGVRPMLWPNCSRALMVSSGRSCTEGTTRRVRPNCTSVFGASFADDTFTPSMLVPFVEPRSLMVSVPRSSQTISQ